MAKRYASRKSTPENQTVTILWLLGVIALIVLVGYFGFYKAPKF